MKKEEERGGVPRASEGNSRRRGDHDRHEKQSSVDQGVFVLFLETLLEPRNTGSRMCNIDAARRGGYRDSHLHPTALITVLPSPGFDRRPRLAKPRGASVLD